MDNAQITKQVTAWLVVAGVGRASCHGRHATVRVGVGVGVRVVVDVVVACSKTPSFPVVQSPLCKPSCRR